MREGKRELPLQKFKTEMESKNYKRNAFHYLASLTYNARHKNIQDIIETLKEMKSKFNVDIVPEIWYNSIGRSLRGDAVKDVLGNAFFEGKEQKRALAGIMKGKGRLGMFSEKKDAILFIKNFYLYCKENGHLSAPVMIYLVDCLEKHLTEEFEKAFKACNQSEDDQAILEAFISLNNKNPTDNEKSGTE